MTMEGIASRITFREAMTTALRIRPAGTASRILNA